MQNRQAFLNSYVLSERDLNVLASLDSTELENQAQTLIEKRLHEARRLLPLTFSRLHPSGAKWFEDFSSGYWPSGPGRHRLDALAFCDFLKKKGFQEVCIAEANRLSFFLSGKNRRIHFLQDHQIQNRSKAALQVLWKTRNGALKEFIFYLGSN
jgi:hypothetical protein